MADVDLTFDFDTSRATRGTRGLQQEIKKTTTTAGKLGTAMSTAVGVIAADAISRSIGEMKKMATAALDLNVELERSQFIIERNLRGQENTTADIEAAVTRVAGFNRDLSVTQDIFANISGEGNQTLESVEELARAAFDLNDFLAGSQQNAEGLASNLNTVRKRLGGSVDEAKRLVGFVATTGQVDPAEFANILGRTREVPFSGDQLAGLIAASREAGLAGRPVIAFMNTFFDALANTQNEIVKAAAASGDLGATIKAVRDESAKSEDGLKGFNESMRLVRDLTGRFGIGGLQSQIDQGMIGASQFEQERQRFLGTTFARQEAAAASLERGAASPGAREISSMINDFMLGIRGAIGMIADGTIFTGRELVAARPDISEQTLKVQQQIKRAVE